MNRFLWGANAGFAGIVNSFGRPRVQHWTGIAFELGKKQDTAPSMATRYIEKIPENADLTSTVNQALEELKQRAGLPGVHSTAFAIDPRHWEAIHVTLWNNVTQEAIGTRYQVLHLSAPHLQDLIQKPL